MVNRPGFCVLYRWRLKDGSEDAFREGWRRATQEIRDRLGGMGSRLHRDTDGTWVAYAQWPHREAWEQAREAEVKDAEAWALMKDAVLERFDPELLEVADDLLVGFSEDET